jgi:2-iminobutanoate/2-iminopropanoate deaminase
MTRSFLLACLYLFCSCGPKEKKVVTCEGLPKPIGLYSPAIESGRWLYVSGQIGLRADGSLDTNSFRSECRQTLQNIEAILKCTGRTMANVCKSTVYVTSLDNYKTLNDTYYTFFTKDVPAREVVEVKALPKGAHVEISVIAN